jgi:hypothetical protein
MRSMSLCALLLAAIPAWAGGDSAAVARPTVIELYTSQGCSSCPPADQLLATLAQRTDVLALSFHVRYWDTLGWPDRFGLDYADRRQARYAERLKLASAFTPQLVIEGERSFVGSDRSAILPALGGGRTGVAIAIERDAERLRIGLQGGTVATEADVLLLALLPQAETMIGAGENGGRRLRETNIVLANFALGRWQGGSRSFTLPMAALPAGATAVAVLVQQDGQRAILGAARAAIP